MGELQIASKNTIKKYIKSSRNCIPCRVTGGLLLRGNNSFALFDFGMLEDKDNCKIVLNFRNLSGNGSINIRVDNYNKRYQISNIKRIEVPCIKELRISRGADCIGDLSLTYIGAITNKEVNPEKFLEDNKTFFDQKSSDINFINSTFSEKENPLIKAQKKAMSDITNNTAIEETPVNFGNKMRHLNRKLFTNNKDKSVNFNELKCNSHKISDIKEGEKYKLLLFFGGTAWGPKAHSVFFNMMDTYDIIVLSSPEFVSDYFEEIDMSLLLKKAFYILCDDNSYDNIIKKSKMVSGLDVVDISKILNIKSMSYKECIDAVLLAARDVKEVDIREIIKEEESKIMTQPEKVTGDLRFKIVVPSYNSQRWIRKTLDSVASQTYTNYDVCIVDDCSTEANQTKIIKEYCDKYNSDRNTWKYMFNKKRKGALFNIVNAIKHSNCDDEDVIITLDGDDWLYDEHVLEKVSKAYDGNVLLTYGQYMSYPSKTPGHCKPYHERIIKNRAFRKDEWRMSHLRTFKYKLFSRIKESDFMDKRNKKYFEMAWDLALMFPMAEMAGHRIKFIKDFLYVYNRENPINDDKVNLGLQARTNGLIRKMKKYDYVEFEEKKEEIKIEEAVIEKPKPVIEKPKEEKPKEEPIKVEAKKEEIKPEPKKEEPNKVNKNKRTSISDNINYPQFCKLASKDDDVFSRFRQAPIYIETLEHVSFRFGRQYVEKVVKSKNNEIISKIDVFKTNDDYGTPEIKEFGNIFGKMAPTTTRYISVLNDLFNIFGDLTGYKIAEVGAGYGGQCKIIHNAFDVREYVIVDLDEAMMLIGKYLSKFDIKPRLQSASTLNYESSDLFISNYAFSECVRDIQDLYLERLAKGAAKGFMLCNFVSNRFKVKSYTLNELVKKLESFGKKVTVENEIPLTFRGNKLVYWKS